MADKKITDLADAASTRTAAEYFEGVQGGASKKYAALRLAQLIPYAKAALPDAAATPYAQIIVTDEVGGMVPAFSDGTQWRRVTDRAIVS